jgi:hypothetical protein
VNCSERDRLDGEMAQATDSESNNSLLSAGWQTLILDWVNDVLVMKPGLHFEGFIRLLDR